MGPDPDPLQIDATQGFLGTMNPCLTPPPLFQGEYCLLLPIIATVIATQYKQYLYLPVLPIGTNTGSPQ